MYAEGSKRKRTLCEPGKKGGRRHKEDQRGSRFATDYYVREGPTRHIDNDREKGFLGPLRWIH